MKSNNGRKNPSALAVATQAASIQALFDEKPVDLPGKTQRQAMPSAMNIITNVQGSSAGAGSGEFHLYKAGRRREYERLKVLGDELRADEADLEFKRRQEARRAQDEERTQRRRRKRELRAKKKKTAPHSNEIQVSYSTRQESLGTSKQSSPAAE